LQNWWSDADYKEFKTRGQCVVDQFDNYTVEGGLHENGKLVLGESIGDLGGVKLAYLAFQKSLQGNPSRLRAKALLPSSNFSSPGDNRAAMKYARKRSGKWC
ncbi:MAG TPA: M13-type metalloendopeptidase, partial [Candidatus Angelobacter sp.]|nr:M13-type metalloendopeptidase [Candidatus Angelobacter sp.]